ncbi:uncharacterized protein [Lepisosteus oculatus]
MDRLQAGEEPGPLSDPEDEGEPEAAWRGEVEQLLSQLSSSATSRAALESDLRKLGQFARSVVPVRPVLQALPVAALAAVGAVSAVYTMGVALAPAVGAAGGLALALRWYRRRVWRVQRRLAQGLSAALEAAGRAGEACARARAGLLAEGLTAAELDERVAGDPELRALRDGALDWAAGVGLALGAARCGRLLPRGAGELAHALQGVLEGGSDRLETAQRVGECARRVQARIANVGRHRPLLAGLGRCGGEETSE